MGTSNNKDKDQLKENAHPAPGADPGAEIETVTPSTEKESASVEGSDTGKDPEKGEHVSAERNDQPDGDREAGNGDPEGADQPEIIEEEKDEPEISDKESSQDESDEDKTVSVD